ncbi:transcriptional corepressor LEUNIG_HOMOLOG-like isoform X2 [Olea europaea var. sylvestris]|uniref:transcriptional corepressor LEUNIG_HOMOLOG-like isoform X2 n=1 Tax=Olea europaea var. sylvestris TaxID=158386 RepID=UPI000C1D245F|nr:transcriptional corepressor LEUNIG_HOMOLOG-like isoform X2 [Olea europaea var. sylvestris]
MDNRAAQNTLDLYIHDYMVRNNMHTSADIFAREAEVIPNVHAINPRKELLTDWWSLFLDVYNARAEAARHSQTRGASSSKDTQTTVNVPWHNPILTRPDFGHMQHGCINEGNKVKQIPPEELPSTVSDTTSPEST